MTKEGILHVIGFSKVGEGRNLRGYGLLFGFPVEATVPKNGQLRLVFTLESLRARQTRRVRRLVAKDEDLKRRVRVAALKEPQSGGSAEGKLLGFFLGGVIGAAIAGSAASSKAMGPALQVTIRLNDEMQARRLYDMTVLRLKEAFREAEITAPRVCPICKQHGGEALTKYSGRLDLVHQNCLEKWKLHKKTQLETRSHGVGHLKGLLGGLLGGVVGALPSLVALFLFEYFLWALFAFIPLGIYYGWRLFGGPLTKGTTAFIIFYTLLFAPVVVIVTTFLDILIHFPDAGITIGDVVRDFLTPEFFVEFYLYNTLMSLLAAVVGIAIAWRQISKTDRQEVDRAKSAFDDAVLLDRRRDDRY